MSNHPLVIGIGGISRSGKSSLAKSLSACLSSPVLSIDSYVLSPVLRQDSDGSVWKDWEDPSAFDLPQFVAGLEALRSTSARVVIAEGFLLYHSPAIVRLLDVKLMVRVSAQVCQERRRLSKNYHPERFEAYFDTIWTSFHRNNSLFTGSGPHEYVLDGELPLEEVCSQTLAIVQKYIN